MTVKLRDVVDQMELLTEEASTYLNKRTGELIMFTSEEFFLIAGPSWISDMDVGLWTSPEIRSHPLPQACYGFPRSLLLPVLA